MWIFTICCWNDDESCWKQIACFCRLSLREKVLLNHKCSFTVFYFSSLLNLIVFFHRNKDVDLFKKNRRNFKKNSLYSLCVWRIRYVLASSLVRFDFCRKILAFLLRAYLEHFWTCTKTKNQQKQMKIRCAAHWTRSLYWIA